MAFEFHTKVSKDGNLKVPKKNNLEESRVKVIIEPENHSESSVFDFDEFVNKWGGFFASDVDLDLKKGRYDSLPVTKNILSNRH